MKDLKDFAEAVCAMLLSNPPKRVKYENRKLTPEELRRRFRLVRR